MKRKKKLKEKSVCVSEKGECKRERGEKKKCVCKKSEKKSEERGMCV